MKKLALGIALGASLVSSVAVAGTQRPTYLAFSAPATAPAASNVVAPVAPTVAKRDKAFVALPILLPILAAAAAIGLVAAVATGGDDDKNQSPG